MDKKIKAQTIMKLKISPFNKKMNTSFHEMQDDMLVDESTANNAHRVQYINDHLLKSNKDSSGDVSINSLLPRRVELYFYLWRVNHIDTVAQSFSVTINISATWVEDDPQSNFAITDDQEKKEPWDLSDFAWNPQLRFLNILEEDDFVNEEWFRVQPLTEPLKNTKTTITKQKWYDQYRETNEPVKVTQYMRKKITLSEAFELHNFPFDLQALHLNIGTSWDCTKVLLTFNKDQPSAMDPNPLDSQEWDLHSPRLIAYDMDWQKDDLPLLSNSSQSITGARYSRAYIALNAMRKPEYYVWNIYVMLFILGTLSFTVFGVDVEEVGDRLSNMLTLVLALVAFKLVLAQALPSISYLTMLDTYTLGSMMLMFFLSVFTSLLPRVGLDMDQLLFADKFICILSAILWGLINLWFVGKAIILSQKRARAIDEINDKFAKYKQMRGKSALLGYKPLRVQA